MEVEQLYDKEKKKPCIFQARFPSKMPDRGPVDFLSLARSTSIHQGSHREVKVLRKLCAYFVEVTLPFGSLWCSL